MDPEGHIFTTRSVSVAHDSSVAAISGLEVTLRTAMPLSVTLVTPVRLVSSMLTAAPRTSEAG